ncbi:MAG: T9SS type A sorting domain-containing protein [Bacteroidota bacterium]|nr:T9SS type A sorting domain-containing protein [Bacteroidota bacterium]
MPAADFVLLKVYDILGNEVAVLVSENQNAGSYSVDFNLNNLNSSVLSNGIYFYKLTAGSLTQTNSMMVLK